MERLVDAIAKGHGDPPILGARSNELKSECIQLAAEVAAMSNYLLVGPCLAANNCDLWRRKRSGGAELCCPTWGEVWSASELDPFFRGAPDT